MKFVKWLIILAVGMFLLMGCSEDDPIEPNVLPLISSVTVLPDSIGASDTVVISTVITDVDGTIEDVVLQYGESITDSIKSMILGNDNLYFVEIGPFANSITINYEIKATDDDDEISNYNSSFTVGEAQPQSPSLFINEFLASNDYGAVDENGDHDDWIEIYNAGDEAIDIGGMYITDNLEELMTSQIPATDPTLTTIEPGAFLVLWADKEPEQGILHIDDVKLSGGGEQIGLTDVDGTTILDSLTYGEQTTDISYGRVPDGEDIWEYFGAGYSSMPTPGTANGSGDVPTVIFFINEFLASNDTCFADEHGDYDDWIEIYNGGNIAGDIGGMYFTDDLTDLTNSQIPTTFPDSTTIYPGEFLIIWADKEPEQGILHLDDVKLSSDGEDIGLIEADGTTILDSYTFGVQTTDVSEGRLPDGTATWEFFDIPTPGASNE